jgi:hypothetical protein
MADKKIQTRISLKYDSYAAWLNESVADKGANLKLLPGELGICEIPSGSSAATTAPTVLFKVGAYKKDTNGNNTTELYTFKELPWASAKAADVYSWAKEASANNVKVKITKGDETEEKTLEAWFTSIDSSLNSQEQRISNVEQAAKAETINALIKAKIDALDSVVSGTGIVKDVVQSNGVVTVTKGALVETDIPTLDTEKIVLSSDESTTLTTKLSSIDQLISNMSTTLASGVRFVGIAKADTDFSSTTNKDVSIKDGSSYTAHKLALGDLVIKEGTAIEYIWTGSAWQELGDQTLLGSLKTKLEGLNCTTTTDKAPTSNKFVTGVTQNQGQISVTVAQPTSSDIKHTTGDSATQTVSAELDLHAQKISTMSDQLDIAEDTTVTAVISSAIDALDVSTYKDETGTALKFVDTIKQVNGKIEATRKSITLNNTVTSTSTTEPATANAVKTAYDVAAGATQRVAAVETDYVKFIANADTSKPGKLVVGKSGTDVIIFDCGNASD